jgi:hypothetical protein
VTCLISSLERAAFLVLRFPLPQAYLHRNTMGTTERAFKPWLAMPCHPYASQETRLRLR